MDSLKVCFVGVGSIAKRHILNLVELCHKMHIGLEVDVFRSGKGMELPDEIKSAVNSIYHDLEEVPNHYDVIFITNPTELHFLALQQFGEKGKNFFIEKPLVSTGKIEVIKNFKKDPDKVYYVACPLRYKRVIQYVKEQMDLSQVYSIRCISSSYLPDWRPKTDYRETYSARKELGGGVSIDLIHEWDYVQYLFGMPKAVYGLTGKVSDLEITSDDTAVYIAKYDDMFAELHLDYYGRKTIRQLQLFMKEETVLCDLIQNQIHYLNSGKIVRFEETRDEYQKAELEYFFKILSDKELNTNTIEIAERTLKLTRGEL